MRPRVRIRLLIAAGLACALTVGLAAPAVAATATATVTAGSLAFVSTPPNVSFSVTLNGLDQTASSNQAIDVGDATGSGTGWNITATSTTFTTGTKTLSTSATTVTSSPWVACDTNSTCTAATNSVTYPYTLPAAGTAPTATKLFNAAANTGMGNQTVTVGWNVAVPANTYAGTYASTWTISLASGP